MDKKQKQDAYFSLKDTHRLTVKRQKKIFQVNQNQKKKKKQG